MESRIFAFILLSALQLHSVFISFASARYIHRYNDGEYGNNFEGDMDLTIEQTRALSNKSRNGLLEISKRWPNNRIIYEIDEEHSIEELAEIERAMKAIESTSCIIFKERTNEHGYIEFSAVQSGCSSKVGYHGNPQSLKLASSCFRRFGTIIHELLHAIGFFHMQSTNNRDDYVKINWENIRPGKENNFKKYGSQLVTDFGFEYDYGSVLHYSEYAFSKNRQPTIEPLDNSQTNEIGQRKGMSETDILKLNKMYECDSSSKNHESERFCKRNPNLPNCSSKHISSIKEKIVGTTFIY